MLALLLRIPPPLLHHPPLLLHHCLQLHPLTPELMKTKSHKIVEHFSQSLFFRSQIFILHIHVKMFIYLLTFVEYDMLTSPVLMTNDVIIYVGGVAGLYAGPSYCQSHMFWWTFFGGHFLTSKKTINTRDTIYTHFQGITNNIYGFGRPFFAPSFFCPSTHISTRPYSFLTIQMMGGRVSA